MEEELTDETAANLAGPYYQYFFYHDSSIF